jgi:integrase/recombinase XerD
MMPPRQTTSAITDVAARYVAVKRALGRRADGITSILRRLDRFLAADPPSDLTRETFAAWAQSLARLHPATQRGELRTVYHFCLFRRRDDPRCFVPDPTQFPPAPQRPLPHIFSTEEIERLLQAAATLKKHPDSPLHRDVARLAIVVFYTTGLRRGELVRLTLDDYDQHDRVLRIRQTKFQKSRLVPVSVETAGEIDRYVAARQAYGASRDPDAPLLGHAHGGRFCPYTGHGLAFLVQKVMRAAGVRTAQGRCPHVHDFRFTFASHALARWYRAGVNVQARLPALATYLGHVSVVSTQYYLTFLGETAHAAGERFHAHCAAWLPDPPRAGGAQ